MTADEINEGLGEFMGGYDLFTESLDACERVADRLGVRDIEMQVEEPGKHWCGVHAWRFADSYGPTRGGF